MTLTNVVPYVEIAFTGSLYATSPTWTDITAYVKSIKTKRGRSNEVGAIEAGTATLVLDNGDGRFTPHRTTSPSPYLNNILPRKQIRIRATVSGVSKPIFKGYTERWSVSHPGGGGYSEVTLECVDALKIFGDTKLLDYYGEYIKATDPTAYYPLFEPKGSIWFNDYSGNNLPVGVLYHRSSTDKSDGGADALLHNSGSTSVSFDMEGSSAGAVVDLTAAEQKALRPVPGSVVLWFKMGKPQYNQNEPDAPETDPYPDSPITPVPVTAGVPRHVTVSVTRVEIP